MRYTLSEYRNMVAELHGYKDFSEFAEKRGLWAHAQLDKKILSVIKEAKEKKIRLEYNVESLALKIEKEYNPECEGSGGILRNIIKNFINNYI